MARSPNDLAQFRGPHAARAQALRSAAYAAMARDIALARRRRLQRLWGIALLVAAGTVAGVFQSCAGSKSAREPADDKPLLHSAKKKPAKSAKEAADGSETPSKSTFDQAATDLQAMFDSMGDEPAAAPAGAEPALEPSAEPARPVRSEPSLNSAAGARSRAAPPPPPSQPHMATPEASPHGEEPATTPPSPDPTPDVGSPAANDAVGPPVPEPISAAKAPTASAEPEMLALGTVSLCSRVESFGRYQPFAANKFLAGRRNAAIVYAEVDHFSQIAAGELDLTSLPDTGKLEADSLLVELSISVELFHDDGSRQWRSGEAVIRDHSRTRRRDFYLVQRIDLPANLSVGKYNLKVTVTDRLAPGSERPQVESVIPIQIVADPGLLGAGGAAPAAAPAPTTSAHAPIAGPEPLKAPSPVTIVRGPSKEPAPSGGHTRP